MGVQLAVIEGAQWEVWTCAQPQRGSCDLFIWPGSGGISSRERRGLECAQDSLGIGGSKLVGNAPRFERFTVPPSLSEMIPA
jgi:hypothetical protein